MKEEEKEESHQKYSSVETLALALQVFFLNNLAAIVFAVL